MVAPFTAQPNYHLRSFAEFLLFLFRRLRTVRLLTAGLAVRTSPDFALGRFLVSSAHFRYNLMVMKIALWPIGVLAYW